MDNWVIAIFFATTILIMAVVIVTRSFKDPDFWLKVGITLGVWVVMGSLICMIKLLLDMFRG